MEARSPKDEGRDPVAEWFEKRGMEHVLVKQLGLRFGVIPKEATVRIDAADVATLERWAERVLSATTLGEVLDG